MLVAIAGALYVWGGVSALSWLVAALAIQGFGALRAMVQASTSEARLENALGFVAAVAVVVFIARRVRLQHVEGLGTATTR